MIGSHTHVTHIIPREKKAVSPNDWLIKLYSEHSVPIVLSSLGSAPQACKICFDGGFMSHATLFCHVETNFRFVPVPDPDFGLLGWHNPA